VVGLCCNERLRDASVSTWAERLRWDRPYDILRQAPKCQGVIGLSSEQTPAKQPGGGIETAGKVLGLLVFAAGIAMIVIVFTWVRGVFDGIDEQVHGTHQAYVADLAARQQTEEAEQMEEGGEGPGSDVVVATPGGGPTLATVGATLALKMVGLLVLGWLGALVAAKGAHLAGAYHGKSK